MVVKKKILAVDFDGVIHSYTSGWQGPRVIPDPPVEGAIQFLIEALNYFDVQVYSSRSRYLMARRYMQNWLVENFISLAEDDDPEICKYVMETTTHEPWENAVAATAVRLAILIGWPVKKPAAHVTLDDRGWRFEGHFPTMSDLLNFKPWNRK